MTDGPQPLFPLPPPGSSEPHNAEPDQRSTYPTIGSGSHPTIGSPKSAVGNDITATSASGPALLARVKPVHLAVISVLLLAVIALVAVQLLSGTDKPETARGDSSPPSAKSANGPTASATGSTLYTTVAEPPPVQRQRPQAVSGVIAGTCDEGGSCGVKQRNAPYTAAPRLYANDLHDDATVLVVCQATGDVRSSAGHGSSSAWYRLDNGAYVNSVYVDLQASGVPPC